MLTCHTCQTAPATRWHRRRNYCIHCYQDALEDTCQEFRGKLDDVGELQARYSRQLAASTAKLQSAYQAIVDLAIDSTATAESRETRERHRQTINTAFDQLQRTQPEPLGSNE